MKGKLTEAPLPPSTGVTWSLAAWRRSSELTIHENHCDFKSPYCSHCGQYCHFKLIALGQDQGHDSQPESWHDSSRGLCTTFPRHLPWCNQSLTSTFLRMVRLSFKMSDLSASAMQVCRESQVLLDLSVWTASDLPWVQTSCSYKDTGYYRYLKLGVQVCIWISPLNSGQAKFPPWTLMFRLPAGVNRCNSVVILRCPAVYRSVDTDHGFQFLLQTVEILDLTQAWLNFILSRPISEAVLQFI